jgi:NhaC family Na+:H+ antiporter
MQDSKKESPFWVALSPILTFISLLVYGLFVHPKFFGGGMLALETILLILLTLTSFFLLWRGYSWETLQIAFVRKVSEAIPVMLILLCIGVLIGSWIVSGTIPMLIYYGIQMVHPNYIYIFGFGICILFSMLTGTSWGSAGTIGIVVMGMAELYEANLAIAAAAVVGGSFFGDKLSPLSDTTNVAALATNVEVYDHIRSMIYTTGPSALIAAGFYTYLSITRDTGGMGQAEMADQLASASDALQAIFNFNIILLLPVAVVIWATLTRKPIIISLLGSSVFAMLLAMMFQDFSVESIFASLSTGFSTEMAGAEFSDESGVTNILNRGGLYNLKEGAIICFLVFTFIGLLDVVNAIDRVIQPMLKGVKKTSRLVVSALTATLFTNLLVSNQYATSFIIGTAFNDKFDKLGIDRKVLSRSLEDTGTMMENMAPWTPSGVFMASALGVSALEYAPWQFLSLTNIIVAYLFAITGIAIFKKKNTIKTDQTDQMTKRIK